MRLVFVSGSPRADSRSRKLARRAMDHAARRHPVHELDWMDLREEALEPFRGWGVEYDDRTRQAVERLVAADALFVASPVYNGSYSSMLKNLVEHTPQDALKGRVAGLLLAGGGTMSFLQVRSHLEAILRYFEVHTVPKSVFGTRDQLEGEVPEKLDARIGRLVDDVVETARRLRREDGKDEETEEKAEERTRAASSAG